MDDLIDNYYSYYDEVESEDPELGIIFQATRPSLESEVEWFSNLYRGIMNGNAIAMVAEEDGRVVGICDVHRVRPGTELSHKGVLGIVIRKGYRGRGIGGELISRVLEEAQDKYEMILLGVFSNNEGAIRLYRKLGFVEYGVLPRSVKRNGKYYGELQMYYQFQQTGST